MASDLGFDFEWPRGRYEARTGRESIAGNATLDPQEREFVGGLASGLSVSEAYSAAFLKPGRSSSSASTVQRRFIVCTETLAPYRPTATAFDMAIRLLVETTTEKIENNALAVAKVLGMLERPSFVGDSESLAAWGILISELKTIFGWGDVARDAEANFSHEEPVGSIGLSLMIKPTGVSLRLRPQSLRAAILFYAAKKAAAGSAVRSCLKCETAFFAGEGGRRADAQFCSAKCRSAFHNEKNRKSA